MAPINILQHLTAVRQEAQRNAAVLDHISIPCRNQNKNKQQQQQQQQSTNQTTNQNLSDSDPSNIEDSPISKRILDSIFSLLDKNQSTEQSENYVFIENDIENHFLIGLVLPLIARVLVVSYPGLLCVVQLPGHDIPSEWAQNAFDGYGSNGSNGSKSGAPTTLSPQDTSRTPSPSDDGVGERKSISPDTDTAALVRHADNVFAQSGAARMERGRSENSPSPENAAHNHRALRLICNGFEVLTGKMPPPKQDMGEFTLATVGWDKAGIIRPKDSSKGVSMSFSNGMMVSTEGIAVTFTNGSLCLLTLRDPIKGLDDMNISDNTPVIIFSFLSREQRSIGELMSLGENDTNSATARAREHYKSRNIFFVEIGLNNQREISPDAVNEPTQSISNHENRPIPNGLHTQQKKDTKDFDMEKRPLPNGSHPNMTNKQSEEKKVAGERLILPLTLIPRSVPLFINTIHRVFLDPPDMDWSDDLYECELPKERCDIYCDCNNYNRDARNQNHPRNHNKSNRKEMEEPGRSIEQPTRNQDNTETGKSELVEKEAVEVAKVTSEPSAPDTSSGEKTQHPIPTGSTTQPAVSSHGHHPYYNYYGYSSHHSYPNSHPNYHVVRPPPSVSSSMVVHHPQPPVGNGQNGYYMSGQPHPLPNGHSPYHTRDAYAHHSYYPLPPPTSVIHPNSGGNQHWHPGVPPVHHPQAPLPPPHVVDTRRDMSVHYAGPNTVASSVNPHYSSQYYMNPPPPPPPQPSNNVYDTATNHIHPNHQQTTTVGNGSVPINEMRSDPSRMDREARPNPNPLSKEQWTSAPLPRTSADGINTQFVQKNLPRSSKESTRREAEEDKDREKALEALIDMGEHRLRPNRQRRSTDPGTESMQARNLENGIDNDMNSMISGELKRKTYERLESQRKSMGSNNELHPKEKRKSLSLNNQMKETNSSTSTNSQGATLKGAMTGNSPHSTHQAYPNSQPWQKKPRQR